MEVYTKGLLQKCLRNLLLPSLLAHGREYSMQAVDIKLVQLGHRECAGEIFSLSAQNVILHNLDGHTILHPMPRLNITPVFPVLYQASERCRLRSQKH